MMESKLYNGIQDIQAIVTAVIVIIVPLTIEGGITI